MSNKAAEKIIARIEMRKGEASKNFSHPCLCFSIYFATGLHFMSMNHLLNCPLKLPFCIPRGNMLMYIVNSIAIAESTPNMIPACVCVNDFMNNNTPKTHNIVIEYNAMYAITGPLGLLYLLDIWSYCTLVASNYKEQEAKTATMRGAINSA